MMMRLLLVLGLFACSVKPRVVFHPTDRMFSPTPGPTPPAYTRSNIATLPSEPMHSVGTIEVTVTRGNMDRAVELATEKGRELGCWIVVEHEAFAKLGTRASTDEVPIILVHGGPPHTPSVRPPDDAIQFDCVVRGAASRSAGMQLRIIET
jgi:hypothetical protein